MPLITCPDCGREVSTVAPACPQCGRPFASDAVTASGGADAPTSAPSARRRNMAPVWILVVGVGVCATALTALAMRPTEGFEEATAEALLNVGTLGFWQDVHYRVRGEYGALWELRDTNSDARAISYDNPTRNADVFRSLDNKSVLVVARDLGNRVECATDRRNGDSAGLDPEDQQSESPLSRLDRRGWPRDLGAFTCRRTGFPWKALHWARIGYVSDDAVRAAIGGLR